MKTLITLIALVCAQPSFAQEGTKLVKGDLMLTAATAEIISVKEVCPRVPGQMSCMAIGSVITLKVSLDGCLDRLGGYSSKFEIVDGRVVLYFGGINISNKDSMKAFCLQAPTEIVKIYTTFEGNIELVNLDFNGMKK